MNHDSASRHPSKCRERRARSSARPPAWAHVLAAGWALAALGCSSDDSGSAGGDTATVDPMLFLEPALACGASTFQACNVLDAACQQALADIAACQWGGAGTATVLPPIASAASAALVPVDMATSDAAASAGMPSDAENINQAFSALYEWIGLAPATATTAEATTALFENLLLASYAFETKEITLEQDALGEDARIDNGLLLHELVHAQQDARYDLTSFVSDINSIDSLIAKRAVYEGEATFQEVLFLLGLLGEPLSPDTFDQRTSNARTQQEDAWLADPATAWTQSIVVSSYSHGLFLTRERWFEGGPEAMVELYANPPTETLRMLEATLGRAPSTGRIWEYPTPNLFPDASGSFPMLGDERYPLATNRLGAWTIYVLALLAGDRDRAERMSLGWRGDQLDAFQLADGSFAGRWRLSFDSIANANGFVQLLSDKQNIEARISGTNVAVALSQLPEKPDWLFGPFVAP